MKTALIIIVCFFILYLLLAYPFSIKLKFHGDVLKMVCFYSLKVWLIKLLCGRAAIENSTLVVQNTNNMLYSASKDQQKQQQFLMAVAKKIEISRAEIYFTGGVDGDAFASALLCGSVQVASSAIISILITENPLVNIYQDIDINFKCDSLEISLDCKLNLSILDIILAKLSTIFAKGGA